MNQQDNQPVGWQRGIYAKLQTIEAQNDSILSILTLLAADNNIHLDPATISSLNQQRRRARASSC